MTTELSPDLLATTLEALPGWESDGKALWRDVHLDPETAAELQRQAAVDGGAMHHSPEVTDRGNGATRFSLSTNGSVTELDIAFASHLSDLVHRLNAAEPGIDAVRDDDVSVSSHSRNAGETASEAVGVPSGASFGSPIMPLAGKSAHSPEPGISNEQANP